MDKVTVNSLSIPKHISSKMEIVEATLHQTIYHFRDLVTEFEQMHMMTESLKKQVIVQKEKSERKCCLDLEGLKKVIESKENIIQQVASALTKLNETKDFSILIEVFRIIYGESFKDKVKDEKTKEGRSDTNIEVMTLISPKKENMSIDEQDVSQIDGTPTGRSSPIIQSKKLKSFTSNIALADKKKCPESWTTPEKKNMKVTLTYPTPTTNKCSGRLRQQRIAFVRAKSSTLVDLTTTPQFSKGRNSQSKECLDNIKREVIDNDDTIMPSPTSGTIRPPTFKSSTKDSPKKFKKPLSLIRSKADNFAGTECKENVPAPDDVVKTFKFQESIDLLKDYANGIMSPKKCKSRHISPIKTNDSVSLLQPQDMERKDVASHCKSPIKRPLLENVNVVNVPCDAESSMSILRKDLKTDSSDGNIKRTKSHILEPLYKEPTVRKRAEKRALPGWSCEQCKNFYGELYKDNLEMQAKKMEECSKHRGRSNPVRPATPPGYWQPRWDIPEDTEEFNKRNNAV